MDLEKAREVLSNLVEKVFPEILVTQIMLQYTIWSGKEKEWGLTAIASFP